MHRAKSASFSAGHPRRRPRGAFTPLNVAHAGCLCTYTSILGVFGRRCAACTLPRLKRPSPNCRQSVRIAGYTPGNWSLVSPVGVDAYQWFRSGIPAALIGRFPVPEFIVLISPINFND